MGTLSRLLRGPLGGRLTRAIHGGPGPNTTDDALVGMLVQHAIGEEEARTGALRSADAALKGALLGAGGTANLRQQRAGQLQRQNTLNTMLADEQQRRAGASDLNRQRVAGFLNQQEAQPPTQPSPETQRPLPAQAAEIPRIIPSTPRVSFLDPNLQASQAALSFSNPEAQTMMPLIRSGLNQFGPEDADNIGIEILPRSSRQFGQVVADRLGNFQKMSDTIGISPAALERGMAALDYTVAHELGHRQGDEAALAAGENIEVSADRAAVRYLLNAGYSADEIINALNEDPRKGSQGRRDRIHNESKRHRR